MTAITQDLVLTAPRAVATTPTLTARPARLAQGVVQRLVDLGRRHRRTAAAVAPLAVPVAVPLLPGDVVVMALFAVPALMSAGAVLAFIWCEVSRLGQVVSVPDDVAAHLALIAVANAASEQGGEGR